MLSSVLGAGTTEVTSVLGAGTTEAAGMGTEPQLASRMDVATRMDGADDTPEPGWVMSERTP